MPIKKISKRKKAFDLFDKGYDPSSPEVKELGIRGNGRYTYHTMWKREQEAKGLSTQSSSQSTKPAGKVTPLPGGESMSNIDETRSKEKAKVEPEQRAIEVAPPSVEEELAEEPEDIEAEPAEEEQPGVEEGEEEVEEKEEKKDVPPKPGISAVDASKIKKDGKKALPRDIIGEGITVTVELSIKTLALWQIAANLQEDKLTLGDFLDTCAEDEYKVRGKDLGLIQLRRES